MIWGGDGFRPARASRLFILEKLRKVLRLTQSLDLFRNNWQPSKFFFFISIFRSSYHIIYFLLLGLGPLDSAASCGSRGRRGTRTVPGEIYLIVILCSIRGVYSLFMVFVQM